MKNQTLQATLLPTEDASILYFLDSILQLGHFQRCINNRKNQHLYLTSDAPIKEGDSAILDGKLIRVMSSMQVFAKKIEFTTDPKLIADGVPAIDANTKSRVSKYTKGFDHTKIGTVEVNFLTEFCKRRNEKNKIVCWNCGTEKKVLTGLCSKCGRFHIDQKDSQKVDVEKLAEEMTDSNGYAGDEAIAYERGIVAGFEKCQSLQSNAGCFSLEDMTKAYYRMETRFKNEPIEVFIQSLTKEQPTADIVIECEMEEEYEPCPDKFYPTGGKCTGGYKIKLNKDGQPTLIFK